MKKIKITQEQYKKIAKLISENVKAPVVPNMSKKVNNSFNRNFTGIKDFLKESDSDLKHETVELIKYLYRKSEDFSPFWAEHDLTYDDICESLESKGMIIKKDGKYELSKSLGSAEQAKQKLEEVLSEMVGGELTEYDNYNYPMGADANPNAPWNQKDPSYTRASINANQLAFEGVHLNKEFAILKDKSGDLYALYYDNIPEEDLNSISDELGFTEKEYVGKDEDGMPDFEYHYNWQNDDDEKLAILAAYADSIGNNYGEGKQHWESGEFELVKMDDELKAELNELYDKDKTITEILSGVNENEESEEEKRAAKIKASLAATRELSKQREKDFFDKRDRQNAIDSKKANFNRLKAKYRNEPTLKQTQEPTPKQKTGQIDLWGNVTEMGTASAMGGTNTHTAGNYQYGAPLGYTKRKLEEMTQGEGSIGQYDANALSIGRNGEFNKGEQPRAFKEPQWAGGTFPQQPECSKPNNNKEAQNGGCNSGASSLKLKKGKGSVNAPSLAKENKIYETIAKQTGKTIDEVKRIIESKKNK